MNKPLFEIIFDDGEIFKGGTMENTKWLEIPANKKIKGILYHYAFGRTLALKDFDKVYHYIEVCKDLNGLNAGKVRMDKLVLIVKKNNINTIYENGIKIKELSDEDEWIKSLNRIGWRG
jgi:hypothetical protein